VCECVGWGVQVPGAAVSPGDAAAVGQANVDQWGAAALQETHAPVAQQHTATGVQLTQVAHASRQILHRHVCHLQGHRETMDPCTAN